MTVQELFEAEKLDVNFIGIYMVEGKYWLGCDNFIRDNWDTDISDLSLKQAAWLTKILDDCVEYRIEKL